MKALIALALSLSLVGCAQVQGLVSKIPSFWDDNQSSQIITVRMSIDSVDCQTPQLPQAEKIQRDLRWFELYSQSKGNRQQDVLRIIQPMQESVDDWVKRSRQREGSKFYCENKKKIMAAQAQRAAEAILGRF
jgi:hypothetical protein